MDNHLLRVCFARRSAGAGILRKGNKMKAWAVTDRNDPLYTNIVFAETRGAAMSVARLYPACEDLEFTEVRAVRVPELDRFYRGIPAMDWYNTDDRIAMVRYGGMYCSYEVDTECETCTANKWCSRYEEET